MSFSISATNPCHVYDLARALHQKGKLETYYSGYPRWKLRCSEEINIRSHPLRTLAVYGLLKTIPERFRPSNRTLFHWQDEAFDLWVSEQLQNNSPLVAIPGQALQSFQRAKSLGAKTILSHATGPLKTWIHLVHAEFDRACVPFADHSPIDEETLHRHELEYELSDFHWAPSEIVKSQLISVGIAPDKIRVIPFGADPLIFRKCLEVPQNPSILFAGQLTWRKGLRLLDKVIPLLHPNFKIHFAGPFLEESRDWVKKWSADSRVRFHGPLSATALANQMAQSSTLILPSVEESFGLIVPQALSCGTPCLVSDHVGAQDLIQTGINGEILPWDSADAWIEAITKWCENPKRVDGKYDWETPTEMFLREFETKN